MLALTRQPQPCTVVDSGWDLDLDGSLLFDSAFAMTIAARISDHPAFSATLRTGPRDREETLTDTHLAVAPTSGTGGRR